MKTASAAHTIHRALAALFMLVVLGAAARPASAGPAPLRASEPAEKAVTGQPASAATMTGKVLETMNASNYTYARVETPAGQQWIAGPQTPLKVGDVVEWKGGMKMEKFTSKTLDRTFDSLLLVDQIVGSAAGGSPHGALASKAADDAEISGVAKAPGGMSVAEIYDQSASLEGKEVTVRGKVVKFNGGVMGRNWLHVRDGSRSAAGDNDLTVTSDMNATVGDTVLVRGTLVLNKDFGFNYKYAVMLERATVTVE
ncbi:MAG TPA: hypothetical protein VN634_12680 [Candidatus Limnocylindrales bacterium]|nr:hypothetical protein [Candidatus Limnocylindrales bacterium]